MLDEAGLKIKQLSESWHQTKSTFKQQLHTQRLSARNAPLTRAVGSSNRNVLKVRGKWEGDNGLRVAAAEESFLRGHVDM